MFIFIACSATREENKLSKEELDSEKEEVEPEEEVEPNITRACLTLGEEVYGPPRLPVLTKAETRELRRMRRLDYSWLLIGPHHP